MLKSILTLLPVLVFASCASIDMPKGTSQGYTSARLVAKDPKASNGSATEQAVHGMIQNSIAGTFRSKGMRFSDGSSDLIVAYLVIYQEPGMTAQYDDYFGYGRGAESITDRAHVLGTVEGKRPDYFERAGIVVDVIDARTSEHIYRGIATGDVVRGASNSTRSARIQAAVNEALADFFG
ncbi:hypothetical protein HAHE_29880 [Haloferula helveola]|uniref:DUF4136 domain-containing protein n=1 Tax=Haloferula helveola TaxID=490095 RepID=A0ABN6H5Y3_9BACT|nr:hypothetical protein HAHE_29880 [Haloferula helveola]